MLEQGAPEFAEVRAWADRQIEAAEAPASWLVEVSMAGEGDRVFAALELAPATTQPGRAWRGLMQRWAAKLAAQPECDVEIGHRLFALADQGRSPDPALYGPLDSFWDALELAHQGVCGDVEEERARLAALLAQQAG